MFVQILLIWCCIPFAIGISQTYYWWKLNKYYVNGPEMSTRLLYIMWSYYEDVSERISDHNHIRFMYEESPHYELGYVMHEVIERYKKMVDQMRRADKFKSDNFYDMIERCELIQKLYFEIYHLVNMMNEIPKKYKHLREFDLKPEPNRTDLKNAMENFIASEKMQKKRDRELKRALKKRRELIAQGLLTMTERPASAKKVPYNVHWPLDYGWDIEWW